MKLAVIINNAKSSHNSQLLTATKPDTITALLQPYDSLHHPTKKNAHI